MALANKVNTILRPGIESIVVRYKTTSDSPQWIDYVSGQRLGVGVIVKFTVSTYQNFTLTSWEAYYSDDYDDTINLSLTSISGESSWAFTMPEAEVWIRCEAQGGISGREISSSSIYGKQYAGTASFNTLLDMCDGYVSGFTSKIPVSIREQLLSAYNTAFPNLSVASLDTEYSTASIVPYVGIYTPTSGDPNRIDFGIVTSSPNLVEGETVPEAISLYSHFLECQAVYNNSREVQSITVRRSRTGGQSYWYFTPINVFSTDAVYIYGFYTYTGSQVSVISVRYILSPEGSGEVTGPAELANYDPFSFTYRIKANYSLQRIQAWSVDNTSGQTLISNSYTYDGETRNYRVTVSDLVANSAGVRVVIQTLVTGDPSSQGGTNGSDGPIGGNGTYDDSSDPIPLPAIPSISASDSGLVTLFRPSIAQIKALGDYLWSNLDEFWENLQKIFTNPMDYIIGLNIFPVSPVVGTDKSIYIGNWLTNISMPPVNNQFYEFNCGTITISEYFGSFLDYAPNTHARIMLPFIGDRDLAVNEIMNKTLNLQYRIDLLSGNCIAILLVDNSVYYQWTGNCAIPIPVTGSDWSRLYRGISTIGAVATAGAIGGWGYMTLASMLSRTSQQPWDNPNFLQPSDFPRIPETTNNGLAIRTGPLGIGPDAFNASTTNVPGSRSPRTLAAVANGALVGRNVMGSSPRVQHTGDTSGSVSIMGVRTPFVVLEYPNVNLPDNYKHLFGYPSNQYHVLGELLGYTECRDVMFESTTATDDEAAMIINALKGGVYL